MANVLKALRYVIAEDVDEFQRVNDLWGEVYVRELGWLPDVSGDLFRDRYHGHSTYLLATAHDTELAREVGVGTMRIVHDSAIGLPIEQFTRLAPIKATFRWAESQRLMVPARYRGRPYDGAPFGIMAGLTKACIQFCFLHQISHVVVDAFVDTPTTPIERFRELGFEEFGSPFQDFELADSSPSVALVLNTMKLLAVAYGARSPLFRYLVAFDRSFHLYPGRDLETSSVTGGDGHEAVGTHRR
jgi:hypothetical protein